METKIKTKQPEANGSKPAPTASYCLTLDPDIAEWAETLEGGLSELVGRLLREAYAQAEAEEEAKWEASFAATTDEQWQKMIEKVQTSFREGRTKPGGFGR